MHRRASVERLPVSVRQLGTAFLEDSLAIGGGQFFYFFDEGRQRCFSVTGNRQIDLGEFVAAAIIALHAEFIGADADDLGIPFPSGAGVIGDVAGFQREHDVCLIFLGARERMARGKIHSPLSIDHSTLQRFRQLDQAMPGQPACGRSWPR